MSGESGYTFLSYAPSYHEGNGGGIFQHQLVHVLNQMGEEAYLWPMEPIYGRRKLKRFKDWLFAPSYACHPDLNTPIAGPDQLGDKTIVVYPEIVRGNPLGLKNVARWLLYKPGVRHPYEFTEGEVFFRAFEKADLPELTGGAPELHLWNVNPIYKNENRPDRKGVCYAVRKGTEKPRIPETETADAIAIDGLGPVEINEIFNSCDTFYSYDEATMYSQYAALCGCLSVVVPGDYGSRAELVAEHDLYKYGIAYGIEDAPHALATRDKVAEMLRRKEQEGLESVQAFVEITKRAFDAR